MAIIVFQTAACTHVDEWKFMNSQSQTLCVCVMKKDEALLNKAINEW